MIHPDTVEQIIDRARIEEVISDFISLKKSGANYKGCCPFHNEKTPSFMVSPAKGIFKCFGCAKGGNAVSFVMEHERLSYVDALKYLAKKYNIEVIETQVSDEDKQKKDVRESLQIVNNFANTYFKQKLHESNEGRAIGLSYFKERGFTDETIAKFELGYSHDGKDIFTQEALKQGYKQEFLERTGLTVSGETNSGQTYFVDRFRGRVMFPIHNLSGNVIGFGGRIVGSDPEKKLAKYLNSPESEIYNKSKTLYGIYFARTEITKKDECILVEGYTDVMSMHQSGITNVVASSGTSLTLEQIQLIKRFTNNILVIYDGDSAGIKASFRGINMILEEGLNVKVLLLPDGDDPDSFAKKHTAQELQTYIVENKTDFVTFKTRLFAEESKNDPIERAKLINDIVHSIAVIPDSITQSVYVSECSKTLQISESILFEQIQKIKNAKGGKDSALYIKQSAPVPKPVIQKSQVHATMSNELYYNEFDIIRLLLEYGEYDVFIHSVETKVKYYMYQEIVEGEMLLQNPVFSKIFDTYYTYMQQGSTDLYKHLLYHPDEEITKIVVEINSKDKKLSPLWKRKESMVETEDKKLSELLIDTIGAYKKRRLDEEAKHLNELLKEEKDITRIIEISGRLTIVKKLITSISKELHHVS
ncbi:MAG TPA: DNA primase [Bacteroidales bacterium]|nr:DNA primase [Bacteroidales bacterium]HRS18165.1 DNA primase [Bacteroidales bacterium]